MKIFTLISAVLLSISLFSQEKGLHPAQSTLSGEGQSYAVVVGISDYQDDHIPDLQYADKDAFAFSNFLQSPSGGALGDDRIKVLINEQATAAQFAIALDWLWEVVEEDDKAIIYFSGHGDVERKSLTQPGYLLCWDSPSRIYMAGGAFNVRDLNDVVSTLSIQNKAKVVLITDACRAGKLSGSVIGGAQATASHLAKQYANEIKILSCQPNEYSIEGTQWGGGRGAFSYHLLNGLYGMADVNNDLIVNLKEIDRYLEDNVSMEVAPHSQNPMTVGGKVEKLTDVFPEILEQLRADKNGHMPLFASTESKNIEDDVLALADSNIVDMYLAFQKALRDKQFLFAETGRSENDYADFYYTRLTDEPILKRLHSSMRRNYAAALQDDAQQVINDWLHMENNQSAVLGARRRKKRLPKKVYTEKMKSFPGCLERAAELLGTDHYMYSTLQARKYFFEGYLLANSNLNPGQELGNKALKIFREALKWEPELPTAYWEMSRVFGYQLQQPDSMEYYTYKAISQHASWIRPYVSTAHILLKKYKQYDKAKSLLEQAEVIDSTSYYLWNNWGLFFQSQKEYLKAEEAYKKAIQLDSTFNDCYSNLGNLYQITSRIEEAEEAYKKASQLDSTNSGTYSNMAGLYTRSRRYDEAEKAYKKAIQLDSLSPYPYTGLGAIYRVTYRYDEAEKAYKKAIQLDSTFAEAHNNLGNIYLKEKRYGEAELKYRKAIQIDSTFALPYSNLGIIYRKKGHYAEAEQSYKKVIEIDSTIWFPYANLGGLYQRMNRWEESASFTLKAVDLAPPIGGLYSQLGNAFTHLPSRFEDAEPTLKKALDMNPDSPDIYIHFAQFSIINKNPEDAMEYISLGLEKGINKGELSYDDLQSEPDFKELRKDKKWNVLMQKYFPEETEK